MQGGGCAWAGKDLCSLGEKKVPIGKRVFLLSQNDRMQEYFFSEVRDCSHCVEQRLQPAGGLLLSIVKLICIILKMFWKCLHRLTADMDLPRTAGNLFVKQVGNSCCAANAAYDLTDCSKTGLFSIICFSLTFGQMPTSQLPTTAKTHWPQPTAISALVFHDFVQSPDKLPFNIWAITGDSHLFTALSFAISVMLKIVFCGEKSFCE